MNERFACYWAVVYRVGLEGFECLLLTAFKCQIIEIQSLVD